MVYKTIHSLFKRYIVYVENKVPQRLCRGGARFPHRYGLSMDLLVRRRRAGQRLRGGAAAHRAPGQVGAEGSEGDGGNPVWLKSAACLAGQTWGERPRF